MLTFRRVFMFFAVVLVVVGTAISDGLVEGFRSPPAAARPAAYYLLLNGYVNRDYIDTEIQQLYDAGIRGLCVFDMGARGPKETLPPDGPEFMSDAWLENFAHILRKAGALGMDVQLAVSSSWDMGASWVKPEDASKALYQASVSVEGPRRFDEVLAMPNIPAKAPRDERGQPVFVKDVAVLAVPEGKRQEGHEFVFELPGPGEPVIDHVVLYNCESDDPKGHGSMQLFAKDFSVAVSRTDGRDERFREILRETLEPHTKAQRFDVAATPARFVRLRIHSGHNPGFERVTLGEFEVYSTEGRNVAGSHEADRLGAAATLVRFGSQWDRNGWTADNIHDGVRGGAAGSWSSAGLPPLVVPNAEAIVDVSDRLDAEGRLRWDVPEGKWTITRFVCANTGELLKVPSPVSNGLATDHFSGRVTEDYVNYLVKRLRERIGDPARTALKQLYLPSYEVRGAVWTDDFIEQFQAYRGYDCTRYLPALNGAVIENSEVTDRFLYDFQKTLGDLLVDAYYRTASASARRAGLGIEAESGGPGPPVHHVPVDALKALGAIDEVRGEFWPWREFMGPMWVVKETACAAHIYGKTRVHMEAFTGFRHWQDGPFELKPAADRAFCEGMNHVVWHTSSHQPPEAGKPGWVYGAGTHLTPNLAWWPMAGAFVDYLSRCSFMLQQGDFVADVCYYYGDQGANFVPPKHVDPSLGYGYDYDVVNPEVILNRMTVRDGRITLADGMRYEVLVLPDRADIDLAVLKKVGELVKAGATVVGRKPARSNGLHAYRRRDEEVRKLADALWGVCDGQGVKENAWGKGKVVWGKTLRDVLAERGVGPDFSFNSQNGDADIDWIHRRTDKADIYFIRNGKMRVEQIEACFRVFDRTPQLWLPDTAQVVAASSFEQTGEGIRVPLKLEAGGSVFVVFLEAGDLPRADCRQVVVEDAAIELSGPWEVSFAAGWGAPESVTLPRLTSWTEHEEAGVRYYSGVATYEKAFDIAADWLGNGGKVCLDLGDLWAVGEVLVNGTSAGVVWKPPYRVDVTGAVRPGRNVLEVNIANTWANRLVGDALSPAGQQFCRTNITGSGTVRKAWKDIELRPSGLFGPVRLIPAVEKAATLQENPEPAVGAVYNLHLQTDNGPDYTDLDAFVQSATGHLATPQEKCIAVWRWGRRSRRQTSNATEDGRLIWDPILHYNSYGTMNCGVISGLNIVSFLRLGYRGRYIQLGDHTVSEVSWDEGATWHLFDSSMSFFCYNDAGVVASCEEIKTAHAGPSSDGVSVPGYCYFYNGAPQCITHRGPDGWRVCSDNPVGYDRTLKNGADSYTDGFSVDRYTLHARWGHRYILNLLPGQAYTRYFRPLGPDNPEGIGGEAEDYYRPLGGKDPDTQHDLHNVRANGIWRSEPDLHAADCRNVLYEARDIETLAESGSGPAVHPGEAGRGAEVVFKISAANVITSMRITGEGARAHDEDVLRMSVSRHAGIDWREVWRAEGAGAQRFDVRLRDAVAGATECLVKVEMSAGKDKADAGLNRIAFTTITQLNRRTLPKLTLGTNRVRLSADAQVETTVLWPPLHDDLYKKTVFSSENVYADSKPDGMYKATLGAGVNGAPCEAVWRVEVPTDICDATLGAVVTNRSPSMSVALLYSFDGERFTEFYRKADGDAPFDKQVVETVRPKGAAREVWLRAGFLCRGGAATYGMPGVQDVLMQVAHRPRDARFGPVEVTYSWTEHREGGDVTRSHTELVEAMPHTWAINVGGFRDPTMNWMRVNLKGGDPLGRPVVYGYSDGEDVGPGFEPKTVIYTWGENVALGRPYTVSRAADAASNNTDTAGAELTNGKIIAPTDYVSSGKVQAATAFWSAGAPVTVTVDLGEVQSVNGVRVSTHQPNAKYCHPERIDLTVSTDGKTWRAAGTIRHNDLFTPPGDYEPWEHDDSPQYDPLPAGGRLAYSFPLAFEKTLAARYIQFNCTPQTSRGMGLSECEVFDKVKTRTAPPLVAPF